MKIKLPRIASTIVLTCLALGLTYGATDANRTALEQVYKDYANALKNKDAKAIIAFETDDFSMKDSSGKTMKRDEANAILQQALAVFKTISNVDEQITDLKMENGTATLMVSEKMVGTIVDPQGKEHMLDGITKSRDIWVKDANKWKIKYSEVLEDTSTLDGKAVK
jgi:ketosteroid isomerase-like protein